MDSIKLGQKSVSPLKPPTSTPSTSPFTQKSQLAIDSASECIDSDPGVSIADDRHTDIEINSAASTDPKLELNIAESIRPQSVNIEMIKMAAIKQRKQMNERLDQESSAEEMYDDPESDTIPATPINGHTPKGTNTRSGIDDDAIFKANVI